MATNNNSVGCGACKADNTIPVFDVRRGLRDILTIDPDETTSQRWRCDKDYPAYLMNYEVYPEDYGVPAGRLGGEKQLPGDIVKLGPHSSTGPKRPCPHCEDGANH